MSSSVSACSFRASYCVNRNMSARSGTPNVENRRPHVFSAGNRGLISGWHCENDETSASALTIDHPARSSHLSLGYQAPSNPTSDQQTFAEPGNAERHNGHMRAGLFSRRSIQVTFKSHKGGRDATWTTWVARY